MLRNTSESYGSISKFFHWLIAFLIIVIIILGYSLDYIPKSWSHEAYNIHKLLGIFLLILSLLRLTWTLLNPKPKLPINLPAWERYSAHLVHNLLYILLIAMPISGWLMESFGDYPPEFFNINLRLPVPHSKYWSDIFDYVHISLGIVLDITVSLHILAALKQHYYDKTNVLLRMMPSRISHKNN